MLGKPKILPLKWLDGNMADAKNDRAEQKSTFRLPKQLHRALKIHSIESDRKMSDLLTEAVDQYLKNAKSKRKRIA